MAGEQERGAARLRGSGELRGGSLPFKISLVPAWSHPIQSTAGVSRVLLRVGEAFPGEAGRTKRDRGDKSQGPLASVLGLTTTWQYLPPPKVRAPTKQ